MLIYGIIIVKNKDYMWRCVTKSVTFVTLCHDLNYNFLFSKEIGGKSLSFTAETELARAE